MTTNKNDATQVPPPPPPAEGQARQKSPLAAEDALMSLGLTPHSMKGFPVSPPKFSEEQARDGMIHLSIDEAMNITGYLQTIIAESESGFECSETIHEQAHAALGILQRELVRSVATPEATAATPAWKDYERQYLDGYLSPKPRSVTPCPADCPAVACPPECPAGATPENEYGWTPRQEVRDAVTAYSAGEGAATPQDECRCPEPSRRHLGDALAKAEERAKLLVDAVDNFVGWRGTQRESEMFAALRAALRAAYSSMQESPSAALAATPAQP